MAAFSGTKLVKQHLISFPAHKLKINKEFLNLAPPILQVIHLTPPHGDRPVANIARRLVSFLTETKKKKSSTGVDSSESSKPADSVDEYDDDLIANGAIVQFWFPPYLNEGHVNTYPLVIDV